MLSTFKLHMFDYVVGIKNKFWAAQLSSRLFYKYYFFTKRFHKHDLLIKVCVSEEAVNPLRSFLFHNNIKKVKFLSVFKTNLAVKKFKNYLEGALANTFQNLPKIVKIVKQAHADIIEIAHGTNCLKNMFHSTDLKVLIVESKTILETVKIL